MFDDKCYAQVLVAFQLAGRTREVTICHPFLLRENTRAVPGDRVKKQLNSNLLKTAPHSADKL